MRKTGRDIPPAKEDLTVCLYNTRVSALKNECTGSG